ncbi:MAG: DNA repair exonuclease, partial [Rhodospirillaceae bacterium]|nr:DNA repair exonuclease [Rhodospirillaceae bacterium]
GLSNYENAPVDAMRGATREALKNLVNLALAEDCAFVVIAGDLFDGSQRDISTALFFAKEMSRLGQRNIRVFIVFGNHDAESQLRTMPRPDNVTLLSNRRAETVEVPEFGVAIHGRSFARRDEDRNLAQTYPVATAGRFNIGILHTALTGHAAHENYAPCSVTDLVSKGYDYWALGHIHDFSQRHENPAIVYPGNLQGRSVRETGAKGAVLVTVENGAVALEHRVLDAARWDAGIIDLTAITSPHGMMEQVRDYLEAAADAAADAAGARVAAVRLTFTGRTPLHAQIIRDERNLVEEIHVLASGLGRDVWVEKIIFQTAAIFSQAEIAAREDAIGDLATRLAGAGQDGELMALIGDDVRALLNKLPAGLSEQDSQLLQAVQDNDLSQLVAEAGADLVAQLVEGD